MTQFGKLRVEPDGDRRILMTRIFEAPREEVFEAWTRPEHVQHWLGVFGGWSMAVCELDPRVGSTWRFVWEGPDGKRMGCRAYCFELDAPERIGTTATFDEPWFEGEERSVVTFEEHGQKTIVTIRLRYETEAARDEVLASLMAQGMAMSLDRLEGYLAEPTERWMDAEAGVP